MHTVDADILVSVQIAISQGTPLAAHVELTCSRWEAQARTSRTSR